MINIKKITQCLGLFLTVSTLQGCYDLDKLNVNPYEKEFAIGDDVIDNEGDDDSKYASINIDYTVTKQDSARLHEEIASAGTKFKKMAYEGFYNDYQITTNMTHDVYSGFFANNQKRFVNGLPDYNYLDGYIAKRWEHFYNDRSKEYREILQAFKFSEHPEHYKNAFYITRIYYAFLASANTDTYGDMPFSIYARAREPEEGNVPYNTQEEVYDMMFKMLEQAVDSIQPNDATQFSFAQGNYDRIYQGDINKWLRFANTLRLRLALRISNVDPERAQKEGEAALNNDYGLMQNSEDNMVTVPKHAPLDIGGEDIGGNENVIAMISIAYNGELVMSKDLELAYRNLSVGGKEYEIRNAGTKRIDPRCLVCWWRPTPMNGLKRGKENTKNDFNGCERGNPDVDQNSGIYSLSRTLLSKDKELPSTHWFSYSRPSVWLSYSESLFLKAEAALRGWKGTESSTEELFRAGIKASMDYYQIDASVANDYIDGLVIYQEGNQNPFNGQDKEAILEQIILQKWLAVFPNGNEGWAEFRRTDYPRLMNQLVNNSGGSVPEGKNIKRILYPNSEKDNHSEEKPDPALNTEGTKLWWDVADTNNHQGERVKPHNFRP